jgi:hypothetical protein
LEHLFGGTILSGVLFLLEKETKGCDSTSIWGYLQSGDLSNLEITIASGFGFTFSFGGRIEAFFFITIYRTFIGGFHPPNPLYVCGNGCSIGYQLSPLEKVTKELPNVCPYLALHARSRAGRPPQTPQWGAVYVKLVLVG